MQKINEQTASISFVGITMKNAQKMWPEIKEVCSGKFAVGKFESESDDLAILDLGLALIALGIIQTKNLYPKDQADRLERYLFNELNANQSEYASREVQDYISAFTCGHDTQSCFEKLIIILLNRWLGENIDNIMIESMPGHGKCINLIVISFIMAALVQTPHYWSMIKENYELSEKS